MPTDNNIQEKAAGNERGIMYGLRCPKCGCERNHLEDVCELVGDDRWDTPTIPRCVLDKERQHDGIVFLFECDSHDHKWCLTAQQDKDSEGFWCTVQTLGWPERKISSEVLAEKRKEGAQKDF